MGAVPDPGAVEAIELRRVRLPYRHSWRAAHGVETHRESTIVRWLRPDGAEGWGECPALAGAGYDGDWAGGEWRILRDVLAPARLRRVDPGVVGHHPARSALDVAALDAALRVAGRSLVAHLGARRRPLPTTAVIDRVEGGPDTVVAAVDDALAAGAQGISIKVATVGDLDRVEAVRRAHPELRLAVDANGSWGAVDDAIWLRLAEVAPVWVEQPTPADDLVGSAGVRRRGLVVALDEPVTSPGALASAIELGALDVANIKPSRFASLASVVDAVELARRHEIRLFCGGMMECGVGRATALAVASLDAFTEPVHLGPSARYFDRDLVEIEAAPDGSLIAPEGPGIGVTPSGSVLDAVTVERRTLRA